MRNEFCYLNKSDNAYDYKIVEFDKVNPNEYITVSY